LSDGAAFASGESAHASASPSVPLRASPSRNCWIGFPKDMPPHPGIGSGARELHRHPTSAAHDSRLTLGPAAAVADLVAKLSVGQDLTVKAFRTEKLADGQYVAQTVTFGDNTVELRDQGLRPVWAQGSADAGIAGTAVVPGRGGHRRGWGRGRGAGWGGPPWSR
jgi:hypothetical protein